MKNSRVANKANQMNTCSSKLTASCKSENDARGSLQDKESILPSFLETLVGISDTVVSLATGVCWRLKGEATAKERE